MKVFAILVYHEDLDMRDYHVMGVYKDAQYASDIIKKLKQTIDTFEKFRNISSNQRQILLDMYPNSCSIYSQDYPYYYLKETVLYE